MSFSAKIDFLDTNGTRYSIPISGIADNCLLTVQPFIDTNLDVEFLSYNDKPTMLIQKEKTYRDTDMKLAPDAVYDYFQLLLLFR